MALTNICFCNAGFTKNGCSLPIMDGESFVSENITPSGSNQQSAAATLPIVRVATDTAIYVAIGENPNATTTTTRAWIPANGEQFFQIEVGNKVAVVTA